MKTMNMNFPLWTAGIVHRRGFGRTGRLEEGSYRTHTQAFEKSLLSTMTHFRDTVWLKASVINKRAIKSPNSQDRKNCYFPSCVHITGKVWMWAKALQSLLQGARGEEMCLAAGSWEDTTCVFKRRPLLSFRNVTEKAGCVHTHLVT